MTTKPKEHICPVCITKTSKIHDYREQVIKDLSLHYICKDLTKLFSMTIVAGAANVSVSTVSRIFNYINYSSPTLPKVLCIDEFKDNAETGKYQCILVDGNKNRVLDVLPDRSQKQLVSYFRKIPRKERHTVEFFVCDMWQPYVDLVCHITLENTISEVERSSLLVITS